MSVACCSPQHSAAIAGGAAGDLTHIASAADRILTRLEAPCTANNGDDDLDLTLPDLHGVAVGVGRSTASLNKTQTLVSEPVCQTYEICNRIQGLSCELKRSVEAEP